MGFFGALFGDKIENENKNKPIFECTTFEERKDWFTRTRPWNRVPSKLIEAVLLKLNDQPPVMLELFVHTSSVLEFIPQYEGMAPETTEGEVACSILAGMFVKVGSPLAQQFVVKKQALTGGARPSQREVDRLIEQASIARDCLELAIVLCKNMIAAYGPLAVLSAESGEMENALKYSKQGLEAIRGLRAESDAFRASSIDSIQSAPEELATAEQNMQILVDAFAAELRTH